MQGEGQDTYNSFARASQLNSLRVIDEQVGGGALVLDVVLEDGGVGGFEPVKPDSQLRLLKDPQAMCHCEFIHDFVVWKTRVDSRDNVGT
jgi:hypothetical protein